MYNDCWTYPSEKIDELLKGLKEELSSDITDVGDDITDVEGRFSSGGILKISNGGTGASTKSAARSNLGLGNAAELSYTGESVIQLAAGETFLYPAANKTVLITEPFESLDEEKYLLYPGDNFLLVNQAAGIVYFSIRFKTIVSTSANVSAFKFKEDYEIYLPKNYNSENGCIYKAMQTWDGAHDILLFMSTPFKIGISSGSAANAFYICQGVYLI